ncbi:DUF4325 domain-containing protein [bacterium]|nr:MAG: DUF4325 domain-containing protein [bacterium]
MNRINIATDFSRTPGARFVDDGPFSGEEFRLSILVPLFRDENDNSKIVIDLDGCAGFPTSFLEEAFGGIARDYGAKRCLDRFIFKSSEDPLLVEEITQYIKDAR